MDFRILGPIEAADGERPIALGAPKQRSLLALLVIHAPRVVSVDRILDALWGEEPPGSGAGTVQFHVSRLRQHLAAAGAAHLVETEPPGYRLAIDAGASDAGRFEALAARARALVDTDPAAAAALLDEALGLWRGPALADVAYEEFAVAEARRLDELRAQAEEDRIDAGLRSGRHAEMIGAAQGLVAEHPLRERPRELLMLALYRAGRQAEALRAYQDARRYFGSELGIEPSTRLRELEGRMVVQDPGLAAPAPRQRLPSGTATLLVAEVAGGTRLWEERPAEMQAAMALHHDLVGGRVAARSGIVVSCTGDGLTAVFLNAEAAVSAAVESQEALATAGWPAGVPIETRMGLHSADLEPVGDRYQGSAVNRAARIASAAHGGQVLVSGVTAELAGRALPSDFDLVDLGRHRLRDLELPLQLWQAGRPGTEARFPPPDTLDAHRHNLPTAPSSFVGREGLLAQVAAALDATRLVTLVGAGGAGKTRVALQVSSDQIERRRDGAWLVTLDNVRDRQEVGTAVLNAIGVPPPPTSSAVAGVKAWAEHHEALIILDNCEHVIEAAAEVAGAMLAAGSGVTVLATSRRPLHVAGEAVVEVPPMGLPPRGAGPEAVLRSEAGMLFADRAAGALAAFHVTEDNAAAVAGICRSLDGIPLAVELAAARLQLLAPQQIDARLGDRFRLLTGGKRDAPARQRTLESAIGWSYDLLSQGERALFEALAVFRGTFDIEAVESITGPFLTGLDPLDLLGRLVDHSLVVAMPAAGSGRRYRMLETVRHYAQARLDASGRGSEISAAHAAHYAEVAIAAGPALTGPDEAGWFQRISDDFPNLRRAVDRLMHGGAAATVLEIATALKPFFMAREPLGLIGRTWVDSALGAAGDADAGLVAKALATAGLLAWNTGDTPAAEQRQAKALEMARSAGDSHLIFQAASDLGVSALDRGDIRRARPLFEEALQLARRFEDPARLAWATSNLAQVAGRADQPVLLDDALELHRQAGRASGVAHVALMHGCLALAGGRPGAASEWFEVSREGWSQLGNGAAEVVALCGLADVARLRGDLSGASANARRALDAGTALGFELGIACSLTSLGAAAALSEGQREAAGEHLERAAGLWQQVGMAPGRARALGLLGAMSAATEGPGGASELFREAGALWGSVDRTAGVGWVRALEAGCALGSGDAGTAFDQARAAVELLRQGAAGPAVLDGLLSPETGGAADVIDACEILGLAAAGLGNPGLGVAILTAATELRETCGVRHDGRRLLQVRAALRTGRRLLGPEATQAAIADGREVARGGPVALMAAAI